MELVLWLILIAIGILFMFSYVIKAVKFIKTDKIHDTARERKLRERELEDRIITGEIAQINNLQDARNQSGKKEP